MNGRPSGSRKLQLNYELQYYNLIEQQFQPIQQFATLDAIHQFLTERGITISLPTLKKYYNQKTESNFIRIVHLTNPAKPGYYVDPMKEV